MADYAGDEKQRVAIGAQLSHRHGTREAQSGYLAHSKQASLLYRCAHMRHLSIALALSLAVATIIAAASPSTAHADATCPPLMAGHFDWDANGPANLIRFQNLAYVYVKDNGAWTMWSGGQVFYNGGVGGRDLLQSTSPMKQYFSDRRSGDQPFAASATDLNSITGIARDGTISLHNNTWNFDTTVNATCVGHTLTAHVSNDLLIITLNDASTPR